MVHSRDCIVKRDMDVFEPTSTTMPNNDYPGRLTIDSYN